MDQAASWRGVARRSTEWFALLAMFAGGLWLQLVSVLHHDPAWLIHGTEVFLDGGQLYQDVFEVNPPLVFYLTVPPVWFARRFGLFDINVFTVYVFLLTAISLAIVWRLLRRDATLPLVVRNGFLLAAGYVLIVYPAERFGQREHLMIVLSLPYLMLLGARARGVRCATHVAIGIGAFGALGLALKPYFLVVPAVAEFYLMVRAAKYGFRRVLRPETLAVASVVLLYGMTIVAFTPTYLTTIVPFAVAVYGAGYGASLSVVLGQPQTLLLPIIVLLHLIIRRMQRAPEIGDILALGACAFFAIFVIQMKGWRYHLYPVDAMLFLLLADMVLWGLADDAPLRKVPVLSAAITGLLVLMAADAGIQRYRASFRSDNSFMTDMAPFVRAIPAGSDIYVFAAGVFNGFPLVNYYRLGWSSRFDTLWLLPGLVAQATPSRKIEQFLRDAVVADLTKHPPALIFVDNATHQLRFGNRSFDYIRYFSADPRFVAIWAGYEQWAEVDDFLVFRRVAPGGRR